MLPISILIATAAMASGVGGATFFTPLFVSCPGTARSCGRGRWADDRALAVLFTIVGVTMLAGV
ncbi:MAG: hypothetical protein IH846_06160 [Acidobacteria bacterium]|nr:hypothetical protein [Acidobacteriota bacterium]